jgi:allantoinase
VLTEVDLLVAGGTLVTEHEVFRADIAVRDGRVAGILEPGTPGVRAGQVLEARGLHAIPGAVDCHVHFNEPGRAHWEGYTTGSAAAAAGGITTVLDMPLNCDPPTLHSEALALKLQAAVSNSIVDYGYWGGLVPDNLDDLAALHANGVVGFKAFMSHSGLDEYPHVDDAVLLKGMRHVAGLGGILALHAESDGITSALRLAAEAAGHREPLAWARARPPFAEEEAVQRALLLARETGARVHFVHVSTPAAARLVAAARNAGVAASLETCPHYLALDETDLEQLGPIAKCAPPLRPRAMVEALWQAVLDGGIDCIASDHSPCPPEAKEAGRADIWRAWGGIVGVQTLMPVLLTEGVHRRRLPLTELVRLTSANPARLFGLHPRKGAMRVGSDADLVLVDLEREWVLTAEQLLTRWPISPFVGRAFRGWVAATLVRGVVVYQDGRVLAQPGHGQPVRPGRADCARQQELSR